MANITLAGDLSAFVANADLTRASGNNATVSGQVLIAAGTSATINQNIFATNFVMTGGTSEATRTTLTIGRGNGTQGDFGVVAKALISTGWSLNGGAFPTTGFATLRVFNSILQTSGFGPALGNYNGTANQSNVRMELVDSQIHNYTTTTFATLGSGEPMVAPGSRLIRTKFLGCQTVWLNGSPTADSVDVSTITPNPNLDQGGFGIAAITDPVTLRKFTGDCFVLQSNPAAFNLIDCQITHSIRTNSGGLGRVYQLGKSFGTNLLGIDQQTLVVLSNTNTVLASTSATGNISNLEAYWAVFSPTAGTYNIPVAELPTITARTSWTIVNRLPLQVFSWSFERKINTATFAAADLQLTTANAKNQVTVAGVTVADAVTGTAVQAAALTGIAINSAALTITVTEARTTQQIYNYVKWWLGQGNNITHYTSVNFNGITLTLSSGWAIVNTQFVTGSFIDANQVGFITAEGSAGNTVELRKVSDNSVIRSQTGDGLIPVAPADVGVAVYLARLSGGNVIGSSVLTPVTLIAGDNGIVTLYFGNAVQVANIDAIQKSVNLAVALSA